MLKGIWITILGLLWTQAIAQKNTTVPDSIKITVTDSLKRHFPNKATMFSAVLPGLGQIYNRQVLKVPFIYGGFIGLGIYIEKYSRNYTNFKRAYLELNDKNPNTTYYYEIKKIFPEGIVVDESNATEYNSDLITEIEDYSRTRDIIIIGTVAFYLLNILDANVNAHFIDFDISEDLAFSFEPVGFDLYSNTPIFGICMKYSF